MDQPEEVLEKLERFNVQKNPEIARELEEYISFVARTGESVFNWTLVKKLYREKLINVITEFYNETPTKELPQYPNVDPFNYETMKKMLIERLDSFSAAPFTIQRISELLADPRKQYSRIDKFMRAVEKNILVVSTVSPGRNREESENDDSLGSGLNGDFSSDVNVDIDMENDGSFTMTKEFSVATTRKEANHEVTSMTQETVTIKKLATKEEEEATTSTDTNGVITSDSHETAKTDVIVETSTVTITVCEPSEEMKTETTSDVQESEVKPETIDSSVQIEKATEDESVIKASVQEPIVTAASEIVEPKIDEDEALLNEPLRPADDEILVDTSQTTPLAALENIVANRTDPTVIDVVIEVPRVEEKSNEALPVEEEASSEQKDEKCEVEEEPSEEKRDSRIDDDDDSEIEAKRLKIEEVVSELPVEEQQPQQQQKEEPAVTDPPPAESTEILEEKSTPIVQEPIEEEEEEAKSQSEPLISAESEAVVVEQPIAEIKTTPEEIPISSEPIVEEQNTNVSSEIIPEQLQVTAPSEITTPLEDAMESTPIIAENQMALDEDVSAATAAASSKMDTDETENETNMDVDDEPMDQ